MKDTIIGNKSFDFVIRITNLFKYLKNKKNL